MNHSAHPRVVSPTAKKLLLLFSAFLVGCSSPCNDDNPEKFETFLQKFSSEKGFARQRTILPLKFLDWESGLDDKGLPITQPAEGIVSEEDYVTWPTISENVAEGQKISQKSLTSTSAVISLYTEASDMIELFHFKTVRGCWHLWQYEDQTID